MESSIFCWFLIHILQINARNLGSIKKIDKKNVMKKERTKDAKI
jgi:hypothetical protein